LVHCFVLQPVVSPETIANLIQPSHPKNHREHPTHLWEKVESTAVAETAMESVTAYCVLYTWEKGRLRTRIKRNNLFISILLSK
jgi:hypothetical protein